MTAGAATSETAGPVKREKRTIGDIRASKTTGEKIVYMSVPDYTSARWAEMGGVDVAVVGDSLAMIAHGHANTIPATMDMMVMHGQAIRRGAPNTFMLGCMPYQSYNTVDRALVNATRFMQDAGADAVKPQGGKSQAHILKALVDAGIPTGSHIGLTPHTVAMFGGFKIQGRHGRHGVQDFGRCVSDRGCRVLHARVRSSAGQDCDADLTAVEHPHDRNRRRWPAPTDKFCSATICSACSRTSNPSSPSAMRS